MRIDAVGICGKIEEVTPNTIVILCNDPRLNQVSGLTMSWLGIVPLEILSFGGVLYVSNPEVDIKMHEAVLSQIRIALAHFPDIKKIFVTGHSCCKEYERFFDFSSKEEERKKIIEDIVSGIEMLRNVFQGRVEDVLGIFYMKADVGNTVIPVLVKKL